MTSACLGTVAQAKVADHLQEFPDGLHVSKLSEVTGIECNYLARILRLLATKHIFREVSPDHFANNRLSIQLVSSNPLSSFSGFCADEILRSSTELHNTIVKSRPDKKRTAWSRATGHLDPVWEYYEKQDAVRAQRFGKAMIGFSSFITFDSTLYGFPWKDLAPKSTVCDLGSGLGHVSMHIAKACPQINIVLQDLPNTIEQAKLIWRERAPEIIDAGRVEFVPVNFLRQSPVTACDYYFMKNVIHNWSDPNAGRHFYERQKGHERHIQTSDSRICDATCCRVSAV
ncbi:hypothetical protein QCA50_004972 [Cerrena zonata]|uniref:O-methyltransferase domain-containing protein n=1 Tax=Cerrena zonata TaxID=2478898 RepID=A0AAW0GDR0_9APHY